MQKKLVAIFLISLLLCGCSNSTENQINSLMQVDNIESNYISNLQSNLNKSGVVQEKTILPQYQKLYEVNSDMIGFIYLDDNHQYPILMREDAQNYYLNHNFFGEEEKAGSIFANVNSSFGEQGISLIYGHCMKDGSMFASISNWKKQDYFDSNKTMRIDTLFEESDYEVVAIAIINMDDSFKYYDYVGNLDETTFNTWRDNFESYVIRGSLSSLTYKDTIVELSTCSYEKKNNRAVLILKKGD